MILKNVILKTNFNASFKDMLGPSERQSATAQPRVISITSRDWWPEMHLAAGKGCVVGTCLSVTAIYQQLTAAC